MFIPYKHTKRKFHTTNIANYGPWSFWLVCYLCSYIWSWPFWICKLFICKFPLTLFSMCWKCLQWLLELCSYIWSWPFWVCKLFICKFPLTLFSMCWKCLQWLLEVTMNFNPFINRPFGTNPSWRTPNSLKGSNVSPSRKQRKRRNWSTLPSSQPFEG